MEWILLSVVTVVAHGHESHQPSDGFQVLSLLQRWLKYSTDTLHVAKRYRGSNFIYPDFESFE